MMANIHHLVDSKPEICSTLKQIGEIAHTNDKEVYVVGVVVRDLFLDRPLNEIDIMVIGDGIQFAQVLAKEMGVKKGVPFPKFSTAHIPSSQVPIEVAKHRQFFLAAHWIINSARKRSGRAMSERLAAELISAANNEGGAIKKKEDTHRMAEANRAFAHFR